MTIEQIKEMQRRIKLAYDMVDRDDCDDGFWGPKSQAACRNHLRSLMPSPRVWPRSDQASLRAFYGAPGDESKQVNLSVEGMGVKYGGKLCRTIRCHNAVASSLLRIIRELARTHPEVLAEYDGCFNDRPMTGGTLPSLHARGAALDFRSKSNRYKQHWPLEADMPLTVMEAFAREGWLSAGPFWGYDAMHHQATS